MQKIKLWSVESSGSTRKATAVADIDATETEQQLEDLLVNSPDLLMDNLTLVGRQLPTEGGPLDLLGVDADGRLVLFELKRGTLTRDAVAQALDYASDLAVLGEDKFARLIDEHSGQNGIEAREGFADWYQQEFQNEIGLLTNPPKIVLVGLGADERARRIVNFLAQRGIEIQLLTFHGFTHEGKLFLARQVESIAPTPRNSATKESNQAVLHETAERLGVKEFLEEVASFIEARMPGYRWPGTTSYSFSLQEKTSEGRPTLRSYATLYLDTKKTGSLLLTLMPRAVKVADDAVNRFCANVPVAVRNQKSYYALDVGMSRDGWTTMSPPLEQLLLAIVDGWKRSVGDDEKNTPSDQEATTD